MTQETSSLKTCAWLLLMLLQDFFASARLHSVSAKNIFLPKYAVQYLYHLKSNNVIGQRKTTIIEKHFYHD